MAGERVLADLVVHFVKSRGTCAKTFKLKTVDLPARGRATFSKKMALEHFTTRKHYAGVHRVDVLLNGAVHTLGRFSLASRP